MLTTCHQPLAKFPIPTSSHCQIVSLRDLGDGVATSLQRALPPLAIRHQALDDLQHYFLPLIPICHKSTMAELYASVEKLTDDDTELGVTMLACAALYAGSVCVAGGNDQRLAALNDLAELFDVLIRPLNLSAFFLTSPSFKAVQAFVMFNIAHATRLAPFAAYGFLPLAIRSVQTIHSPVHLFRLTEVEQEECRALWLCMVSLDFESTIANGLDPLIGPGDWSMPSKSLVSTDSGDGPRPLDLATHGQWHLIRALSAWYKKSPEYRQVLELQKQIRELRQLIKESKSEDHHEWARLYLDLQADRAICVIGLYHQQLDSFTHTACHSEVVSTARTFLKTYISLSNKSIPCGFQWFVPGLLQPFHGLAILLLHLTRCSNLSQETDDSFELLREVFSLRRRWINTGLVTNSIVNRPALAAGARRQDERTHGRGNPRYRWLIELKEQIWSKFDWPTTEDMDTDANTPIDLAGHDGSGWTSQDTITSAGQNAFQGGHWTFDGVEETFQWDDWIAGSWD